MRFSPTTALLCTRVRSRRHGVQYFVTAALSSAWRFAVCANQTCALLFPSTSGRIPYPRALRLAPAARYICVVRSTCCLSHLTSLVCASLVPALPCPRSASASCTGRAGSLWQLRSPQCLVGACFSSLSLDDLMLLAVRPGCIRCSRMLPLSHRMRFLCLSLALPLARSASRLLCLSRSLCLSLALFCLRHQP